MFERVHSPTHGISLECPLEHQHSNTNTLEHQHRYTREHDEYSIMNRRTRESKNVKQQGTRPLHYAITRGDMELVDVLVSVGAIGMVDEEHNENLDVHEFNLKRTVLLMAGGGVDALSSKMKSITSGADSDWDM